MDDKVLVATSWKIVPTLNCHHTSKQVMGQTEVDIITVSSNNKFIINKLPARL
jgi:hypothetical protein